MYDLRCLGNRKRVERLEHNIVIENLIAAGTELWILRLIERMDRNRVQPLLCLINGSGAQSQALEPVDCPVLRLNLPSLKTHRTFGAAAQLRMRPALSGRRLG